VPLKLPVYVTSAHFTAIYLKCDAARFPEGLPYPTGDWWRALLVTGYMTGWRISELLALRRADVDLDAGTALTRAEDNKGKRDARRASGADAAQELQHHPAVHQHGAAAQPGGGGAACPGGAAAGGGRMNPRAYRKGGAGGRWHVAWTEGNRRRVRDCGPGEKG